MMPAGLPACLPGMSLCMLSAVACFCPAEDLDLSKDAPSLVLTEGAVLGGGAFSRVIEVIEETTGNTYAMKRMRKQAVVQCPEHVYFEQVREGWLLTISLNCEYLLQYDCHASPGSFRTVPELAAPCRKRGPTLVVPWALSHAAGRALMSSDHCMSSFVPCCARPPARRPSPRTRRTPSASGSTPPSRTSSTCTSCLTSCRGATSWTCWSQKPRSSGGGCPQPAGRSHASHPRCAAVMGSGPASRHCHPAGWRAASLHTAAGSACLQAHVQGACVPVCRHMG